MLRPPYRPSPARLGMGAQGVWTRAVHGCSGLSTTNRENPEDTSRRWLHGYRQDVPDSVRPHALPDGAHKTTQHP